MKLILKIFRLILDKTLDKKHKTLGVNVFHNSEYVPFINSEIIGQAPSVRNFTKCDYGLTPENYTDLNMTLPWPKIFHVTSVFRPHFCLALYTHFRMDKNTETAVLRKLFGNSEKIC